MYRNLLLLTLNSRVTGSRQNVVSPGQGFFPLSNNAIPGEASYSVTHAWFSGDSDKREG